jgi:hypothetical protein
MAGIISSFVDIPCQESYRTSENRLQNHVKDYFTHYTTRRLSTMIDNTPHLFWPQNLGPFDSDLKSLFVTFQQKSDQTHQLLLLENALQSIPYYPNAQEGQLRYRAFLSVLIDLLRQEWIPEFRQGQLYLLPPDLSSKTQSETEAQERKKALRQSLAWERKAQFEKASVRDFIHRMEQEHSYGNFIVSIRSLIAEGGVITQKLQKVLEIDDETEIQKQITTIIQPYLQLITPGARCKQTGLYLQDIWRYFRYTWSTPYNPTPGRQMFYLIRDAAQQFHPVIGIAALGSSMVQLSVRDDIIGWSPAAIQKRISSPEFSDDQAISFVQMLHQTLKDVIDDLAVEDLVTADELANPSTKLFQKLADIEKGSKEHRISLLKDKREWQPKPGAQLPLGLEDYTPSNIASQNFINLAQEELYRGKRAGVLRQILQAKQILSKETKSIETAEGLRSFWKTANGQQAIKILVRENKKKRIGINMMDIIVCGSIPPYNTLLGGKLVAMLLTSPQIIRDYQEKYAGYASTIASKMKGQEVRRDSQLVLLGTTSLYSSNSSQYNRIAIPVIGHTGESVRFIRYGLTEGYGSVHFSGETVNVLAELQELIQGARLINNRFGEGVNPKLRKIRTGLAAIGLQTVDNFLRHRSQRIIYGIPLGRKSYKFLCGETDDPEYFFETRSDIECQKATKYICDYWSLRWLQNRVQSRKNIEEIQNFRSENFLLSKEISSPNEHSPYQPINIKERG